MPIQGELEPKFDELHLSFYASWSLVLFSGSLQDKYLLASDNNLIAAVLIFSLSLHKFYVEFLQRNEKFNELLLYGQRILMFLFIENNEREDRVLFVFMWILSLYRENNVK